MARALVSVIIPTLNSCDELALCLGSLSEGLSAGLIRELIVTDGGSSDETLVVANEAGATVMTGPRSRGGQLRRGCEVAKGDWVLVLHADTQLSQGWSDAVIGHIIHASEKAGYFRLSYRAKGTAPRLVGKLASVRSRMFGLPYGDQGLLIPRSLYNDFGGFSDIPLMEDVELVRKLKGQLAVLEGTVSTSADRYIRQGWLKRGTLNILMLLRFLLGTAPEKLAQEYNRK